MYKKAERAITGSPFVDDHLSDLTTLLLCFFVLLFLYPP